MPCIVLADKAKRAHTPHIKYRNACDNHHSFPIAHDVVECQITGEWPKCERQEGRDNKCGDNVREEPIRDLNPDVGEGCRWADVLAVETRPNTEASEHHRLPKVQHQHNPSPQVDQASEARAPQEGKIDGIRQTDHLAMEPVDLGVRPLDGLTRQLGAKTTDSAASRFNCMGIELTDHIAHERQLAKYRQGH
eukprot:scaffold11187_cov30-Tisochrysis_lutea.AAC.3